MYLGIEIGGTKLQLGLGGGDGRLAGLWRRPVEPAAGAEGIRRHILAAVPELLDSADLDRKQLQGVGIGFGGPVDDATRTVIKSHQIPGWEGFPLADWLAELLDVPAVLGNDADVAGLAEARFGAGRGLSPIFYITLGSGIGGGLIVDGHIYRGCGRGAAEIGHLRRGDRIIEQEASGWAIREKARAALRHKDAQHSLLSQGDPVAVTGERVAQAAAQGDLLALQILHSAWAALAEAISQVMVLLCPRRIVIGGGVSLMGEKLLFEPLRRLVAERVFAPFAACYDIVPAALGEEVVVHGALALARQQ